MPNAQRRITLFADSLALPRGAEWGNVPYEKTYPFLFETALRNKEGFRDFIFVNRAQRFRTVTDTLREYDDFSTLKNADTVILHCGIVDCAPRVFSIEQRKWLEKLPWRIQQILVKTVHKFRKLIITHLCKNKVYTSLSDYTDALRKIFEKARVGGTEILAINIIVPTAALDERSPGYIKNAVSYNEILHSLASTYDVKIIDINDYIHKNGGHDILTTDGMHINEQGHTFVAKKLLEIIAS